MDFGKFWISKIRGIVIVLPSAYPLCLKPPCLLACFLSFLAQLHTYIHHERCKTGYSRVAFGPRNLILRGRERERLRERCATRLGRQVDG